MATGFVLVNNDGGGEQNTACCHRWYCSSEGYACRTQHVDMPEEATEKEFGPLSTDLSARVD